MNTCKVVGIGCLGRSGSFQRIWQKVIPALAGKNILPQLNLDLEPNAVKSASFYIDRDETLTVNLSVQVSLKTKCPYGFRKPVLKMIRCG